MPYLSEEDYAGKDGEISSTSQLSFVERIKLDQEKAKISWKEFRELFLKNGGERFYGAWSLNYLEPSLAGKEFKKNNK